MLKREAVLDFYVGCAVSAIVRIIKGLKVQQHSYAETATKHPT